MIKALTRSSLGLLVLTLLAAGSVRAAEERSRPFAVVVGVSRYADPQIQPRAHAEADATALYDLLSRREVLGAEPGHVRLLLGQPDGRRPSEPATRDNILKALQEVAARAGANDLVLFAFFGQGAPLGERTCYFASDSTFKGRDRDAVAAADVEHTLESLKSQKLCAFLDVNFKGFDAGDGPAPELNPANLYKEFLSKEDEQAQASRVVFLAGRGVTPSLDLERHGVFAQAVLDGLGGKADKEGYEPDGLVTVDELKEYLTTELSELARKNGKTREQREQAAVVLGADTSHFVLTHNPAVAATVKRRLDKLTKLAGDQTVSLEWAEEGRNLLSRMPRLEVYRSLRKAYQQLVDGTTGVDEFKAERRRLLDALKLRRSVAINFANKVIEASQQVCESYIKETKQGELVAWAVRGLYQRIDEPLPQDVKEKLEGARKMSEADLTALLADVRQRLGQREDLDNHKDVDHALQKMLSHLDPHTAYIDPETLSQFEREVKKNYTGVGIQIRKDVERDMIRVVTPIKGSPAYKAGLRAGDLITRIVREVDSNGRPLDEPEVISTKGLALTDAVKKVLGKADTKVRLTIEREGANKPFDVDITRSYIELETVFGVRRKADDSWDYWLDPENKIGYVRLSSFAGNTARDLTRVLTALDRDGLRGLVLDLRFNPGGLLRSAVSISDLFMDEGPIVSVRPRAGKEETHRGRHSGSYLDFPMVCLVNGGSASASEIVSAALQDHKRAVIVGERSYGKGSVQNIQSFDGGQLKMTIATFWRPSGKNLNKASTAGKEEDEWGVTPNEGYAVKLSRPEREQLAEHLRDAEIIPNRDPAPKKAEKPEFRDRQLDKALDYLRGRINTAYEVPLKKKAG